MFEQMLCMYMNLKNMYACIYTTEFSFSIIEAKLMLGNEEIQK